MTLYLLEINNQGLVQQLAIVEGELDDFKDSTVFKAFTSSGQVAYGKILSISLQSHHLTFPILN